VRVIAGAFKGRRLEPPAWPGLRPTSDKLRETLFNVLRASITDARVMDGFAGTGAVGIEALSRGAAHVTFVEADPRALALVTRNLERCGIASAYAIIRADLSGTVARPAQAPFDIVFLDPPYQLDPADVMHAIDGWLTPEGALVLEHARRGGAPERVGDLARVRQIASGDSALSFYRHE
jgi:16S rRNA (guanine(966)-N(2))-methyltransferase RsmD